MTTSTPRPPLGPDGWPTLTPPTTTPAAKRRHWPWIVTAIVVALIAIGLVTNATKSPVEIAAVAAPVTTTATVTQAPVTVTVATVPPACLKLVGLSDDLLAEMGELGDLGSDSVHAAFDHDVDAMTTTTAKLDTLASRVTATRAQLDLYGPQCSAAG